jgi:hypothetical protein
MYVRVEYKLSMSVQNISEIMFVHKKAIRFVCNLKRITFVYKENQIMFVHITKEIMLV